MAFLRFLLRQLPGKLLVVWDRAMIHRCKAAHKFLADGAAKRLRLLRLPGYAPELNPVEGVRPVTAPPCPRWLKRVALANVCCEDFGDLRYELQLALAKPRYRPNVLRGCRLPLERQKCVLKTTQRTG